MFFICSINEILNAITEKYIHLQQNLTALDLSDTDISALGLVSLKNLPHVKELYLNRCYNLDFTTLVVLAEIIEQTGVPLLNALSIEKCQAIQ